jgi:hypothetical protein
MDSIDYIYVALAAAFLLVMVYMFTYNTKMRRRENALKSSRSKPIGKQEANAMAAREKSRARTKP